MANNWKSLIFWFVFVVSLFFTANFASAAGFKFSPASGNFNSGTTFGVTVLVDSEGAAINAAEATFRFPSRLLEVSNISTNGSIFKFWAQEPNFSNSAGTISFSGGLPSPGFNGTNGKIFTITFRTKGAGQANLEVTNGAILANDGLGTNLFTASQLTNYSIQAGETERKPLAEDEAEVFGLPEQPVILSKTHPNENQWYNLDEFQVGWQLPTGVDNVSYALFSNPNYVLPAASKGLLRETTYDLANLNDGVWYFFVRFHNSSGWGPIARRAVLVDRRPPEPFLIIQEERKDKTDPRPKISFTATDKTSGIGRSEIKIGESDWLDAEKLESPAPGVYLLPIQPPGRRPVTVRVFDRAGNYTEAVAHIEIQPLPTPIITNYTDKASPPQKPLIIEGEVDFDLFQKSEFKIHFRLRKGDLLINFDGPVDAAGNFLVEYRNHLPEDGDYYLTAQLVDKRGAVSYEGKPVTISIRGWINEVLTIIGEYTVVIIGGIIALGLIVIILFFMYSRILIMRRRFIKELDHFEKKLKKDAVHLESDLREASDKTVNLSREAQLAERRHLRKDIQQIEKDIIEEIRDIKKLE